MHTKFGGADKEGAALVKHITYTHHLSPLTAVINVPFFILVSARWKRQIQ